METSADLIDGTSAAIAETLLNKSKDMASLKVFMALHKLMAGGDGDY